MGGGELFHFVFVLWVLAIQKIFWEDTSAFEWEKKIFRGQKPKMTKKNRIWNRTTPLKSPKFFFEKKNSIFHKKNVFLKKFQMHLLVIGWSYRHQNTSKGLREQVETIFDQFRKIFFSEFLIENRVFLGFFSWFLVFSNHSLPKMGNCSHLLHTEVFFSKTSTNFWNFGGISVFLWFVVIFLSLFKKK